MMSKTTFVPVVALATAGVAAAATPASAAGYLEDAREGLENSPVYEASNTSFSNTEDLVSAFQGQDVAIVNLPVDGSGQLGTSNFANSLNNSLPGYDTVIVVQEGSSVVGVSGPSQVEIATSINQNMPGSNAGEAILASREVIMGTATTTSTEVSPDAPDLGLPVSGVISIIVILLAIILIAVMKLRGEKTSPSDKMSDPHQIDNAMLKGLPAETTRILEELADLREEYVARNQTRIANNISEVIKHTAELMKRVSKKSGGAKYQAVTIKYNDTLSKLTMALGPDYYLDIHDKPRLWADSEKRMEEVRAALTSTDEQIIRNIQQVNANQDLEIQVALDSLTRSMSVPALENIYKK